MATTQRLLATTALLASAVLALTACDPDDAAPGAAASATASSSATASVPATASATAAASPSAGSTSTGAPSAKPTKAATPKASASKAAPSQDCTAAAQRPGHKVIHATNVYTAQLTATATTFVCGPNVENDGYWTPVGAPVTYTFAAGATAELVTLTGGADTRDVPLGALLQHVNDCAAHVEPPAPYSCFGGYYDITVDGAGHITKISELFRP